MQELEATWNRSMPVWWLLLWRGIVGGFVFGAIIGAIAGVAAALLGGSVQDVVLFNSVLGPVVGIVWATFVVRMALRKKYAGFRIALIPTAEN
jgi:cation transporter-like permease